MSEEHTLHPEWDRHNGDRAFHRAISERFGHVPNIDRVFRQIGASGGFGDFANFTYHCFRAVVIILMTLYDRVGEVEKKMGIEPPEVKVVIQDPTSDRILVVEKKKAGRPRKEIEIGTINGKRPYEMTANEYFDAHDLSQMLGGPSSKHARIHQTHRSSVERALKRGINVEDRVLAKYPEFNSMVEKIRFKLNKT